ncbi:Egg cell-secreted protein 1.4 [Hibiscus syriacus]|uniref:Egg cell-secreted protein 1.4 n=1 Tax=Hibiscus syriacus TaxID=106335 RepID=A0A6A3A8H4_HIBSY|nr:Egg cell-secreted protein 1.4 [Hibiscus syriacus]
MALRDMFHVLVLVCCLLASVTSAARLDDNRGLAECWNALNEMKSCTDEIVIFLVNGQADIDADCCHAIEVITRDCWPTLLTSLGFTSEEGNILRGYCDVPSALAPAAVAPLAGSPASPAPVL